MIKDSARKILVTFMAVSLVLSFSISSFAGYSFQEDGDAINENFSGTNYVYTNGVYVGELGTIDAYMDNYGNTYNGTNIIDATAYPGVGQDDESTYNGTLAVTANDILSSKTTVDDATVNAATTVTVNEVLTDNNLNAGVQFNNSEFNSNVTLSGSGAVNLSGSTVNNLVIGDIPLMNNLLRSVYLIYDSLSVTSITTSPTRTFTMNGMSITYGLIPFTIVNTQYYVNMAGLFRYYLNQLAYEFSPTENNGNALATDPSQKLGTYNGLPVVTHRSPYFVYSYDSTNDVINKNISYRYLSFATSVLNILIGTFDTYLTSFISYLADTWYRWYNPNISADNSQFWIAFNTDTEQYDHVNLSTVFGYITWYLGQLYIQGNEAASDISQSVSNLSDTLTDFETKEGQINNSIKSSLNNVDSFFQLPAVTAAGTVIGWLQYMWVSLGTFQAVTIIAWALVILTIVTGFYKVKRITV